MVLRGFIRPQDVSPTNMINSWRIGEAELVYTTKGTGPKGGIIGRLLGMIWP
jgi:flagellar basal body L-ring protein FlgH